MRQALTGLLLAASFLAGPVFAETPDRTAPALPQDAMQRLVQAGSEIEWLDPVHGFQVGVAHSADHVMVFFTPPDRQVLLGGTLLPVPYDRLAALVGGRAHPLDVRHGLRGMFVQSGQSFQVVYATPDGQAVIAGTLWDAEGHNLTRQQIRYVPGAVPTVHLTLPEQKTGTTMAQDGISTQLYSGTTGARNAPEVSMFIDPRCSFSIRAMQQLQPAIDAGRLRVRVIPVSLLDYEDQGASTQYAHSMLSQAPDKMVAAWMSGGLEAGLDHPSDQADARLARNMAAARDVSLAGTPTFFWKKHDGTIGRLDGVPPDVERFIEGLQP